MKRSAKRVLIIDGKAVARTPANEAKADKHAAKLREAEKAAAEKS